MNLVQAKVWFHRGRAVAWLVFGAVSFAVGWADSIGLVWFASVYANVVSDLGAAEAADDRATSVQLTRIEEQNGRIEQAISTLAGEIGTSLCDRCRSIRHHDRHAHPRPVTAASARRRVVRRGVRGGDVDGPGS